MPAAGVSLLAVSRLDLRPMPTWAILTMAVVMWTGFGAALARIFPAGQRARQLRRIVPVMVMYLLISGIGPAGRRSLWNGAMIAACLLPALLWHDPLSDDLPPAGDPRRRSHPRYAQIEARGRRIGYIIVVLLIGVLVTSIVFVQGP